MTAPILEARGIAKHFRVTRGALFARKRGVVRAVDGVDLAVAEGETLGLVGESGCGKTTLGRLLLLLERPTAGAVRFEGGDAAVFTANDRRRFRRAVQPVFQNPFSSLDPRMTAGRIVAEPLAAGGGDSRAAIGGRVAEVLDLVGLRAADAGKYPHEFSGGQRQRIAIARALASSPRLVVLDEAVSSQDISIRAQLLNLLKDLQQRLGMSYLFIAHDLATVRYMSRRIGVMYLGKMIETAPADALCRTPLHPYTQALFAAALPDDPDRQPAAPPLAGEIPSPLDPPDGCRFHTRCPKATPRCAAAEPPLKPVGEGRTVACVLYD